MRRHRLPGRGKLQPKVCFAHAIGIKRRASFGCFDEMTGDQARCEIMKKRLDFDEQLARNVFCSRRSLPKMRMIFIQKFVIEAFVQNRFNPRLDLADVDQHAVGRIHLAGENKISDVVPTGPIASSAIRDRMPQYSRSPTKRKQRDDAKRKTPGAC